MAIGVVTAMPAEAATLAGRRLRIGEFATLASGLRLACAGIGADAALRASAKLVDDGVTGLVSWGCTGALNPELGGGDLVLPPRVIARDGASWPVDSRWWACLGAVAPYAVTEVLADSAVPLARPWQRRQLAQATGAGAVDMESATILRVSARAGLPAVVIRAVADTVTTRIPGGVVGRHGLNPRPLLWPWNWPDAVAMARGYWLSLTTLRAFARHAGVWARVPAPTGEGA